MQRLGVMPPTHNNSSAACRTSGEIQGESNSLGPVSRFGSFGSTNPRYADSKTLAAPRNLKRQFDAEIEGEEIEEMDRVRDDSVNVMGWVACVCVCVCH